MKTYTKTIIIVGWFSMLGASLFFGPRGFLYGFHVHQENMEIRSQIKQLTTQVQELETSIHNWQTYDFFKEQMAREQLQLARSNEMIYLLK